MSDDRNRIAQIEAACLSCLFTTASEVVHVGDILAPGDFAIRKHGVLFGVMIDLIRSVPSGEKIDYILVVNTAASQGCLKDCGGAEYILTLSDEFAPSRNPISYAQIVFEESRRRQIDDCIDNLKDLSSDDELDASEVAKELRILTDILDRSATSSSSGVNSIADSYLSKVRRVYDTGRPLETIRFGHHEIDSEIGGLEKSDVCVVAARPSQGKTSMGFGIALNVTGADPSARVMIFSLEMHKEQAFDRMVATLSDIQTNLTRHRAPTSQEMKRIESTARHLAKRNIIIEDKKTITVGQIRSAITTEQRKHGRVDLVIIDYIQLLSPTIKKFNRNEEMGTIAKDIKVAAGDLSVPIIALAQLNRDSEKRNDRPRLSDIRESGDIEAAADQVIMLHNPGFYEPERPAIEDIEVIIGKNRHGSTGLKSIQFDRHRSTFISSTPADPPGSSPDPDEDPFD